MTFETKPDYYREPAAVLVPVDRTMSIVALIFVALNLLLIPTAAIGAILGHVAYSRARREGRRDLLALTAIIAGWAITSIGVVILLVFSILMSAF